MIVPEIQPIRIPELPMIPSTYDELKATCEEQLRLFILRFEQMSGKVVIACYFNPETKTLALLTENFKS